ncbi:hypothetical protein ANTQUA_LOCUS10183 [Anthophora quadrimaculata]
MTSRINFNQRNFRRLTPLSWVALPERIEITFRELINPRGKQGTFTTRLLVKSIQGVAMVFEDAFVVFSRFLSLKSRGCALLETHRQRETTGIKKLYNSFFVMF